jgi:hypothetical protein
MMWMAVKAKSGPVTETLVGIGEAADRPSEPGSTHVAAAWLGRRTG